MTPPFSAEQVPVAGGGAVAFKVKSGGTGFKVGGALQLALVNVKLCARSLDLRRRHGWINTAMMLIASPTLSSRFCSRLKKPSSSC